MNPRWIPTRMGEEEFKKGSGKVLQKVYWKLTDKKIKILNKIYDKSGLIGYEIGQHVVVAKTYSYGWIVSAHKKIVELAQKKRKGLVMYIDKSNRFYMFNPKDVLKYGKINYRGDNVMINFDINMGELWLI